MTDILLYDLKNIDIAIEKVKNLYEVEMNKLYVTRHQLELQLQKECKNHEWVRCNGNMKCVICGMLGIRFIDSDNKPKKVSFEITQEK